MDYIDAIKTSMQTQQSSCMAAGLPSHKSAKMNEICGARQEKQRQTHRRRSLMGSNNWTHQCWSGSKDTGYRQEDLPKTIVEGMDDERGRNPCPQYELVNMIV